MFSTAFLDIPPLSGAQGTVSLPGSKSISNRVLLLAALSQGTTVVHDLLDSDDTRVMLRALQQLGCTVEPATITLGKPVRITGLGGVLPSGASAELFMGNAGTAMRPLTAALSVLGGDFQLSGVPRMHERPIGDLVDALRQLGCRIDYLGNEGFPPLHIRQPDFSQLPHSPIQVRGDVSSQFLTSLLMALPLLAATRDITIEVVGELISKPYIHITLELLARFGIAVHNENWQRFTIPAGSRYRSPGEIHVEADASSASYFIALGAEVEGGPNWLRIRRGAWPLKAIDLDCNHIPDAAMTLAVMALYADGTTTLRNIASWRVKETDRIAAMTKELRKLGAEVEEGADFIRVTPPASTAAWRAASIHTYDDHRVAMCFSLAAFNPAALPVRIEDPKCVAKTFPDYFEALFSVCETARARIPVICIDGPTASGKGTIAAEVAEALGYHLLDSGALYRLTGLAASRAGMVLDESHAPQIAALARALPVRFDAEQRIWLGDEDVTLILRSEESGMNASRVSALPAVRDALVDLQLSFQQLPGLVADGRDMGTVIFPHAPLKVYLSASAACRAERRHKQLISKGIAANISALRADLEARDARDMNRSVAPLKPAQDSMLLDSSELSIEEVAEQVLSWWQERQPFGRD